MSVVTGQYKGRTPLPLPMVMGHEGAGVIAEVGQEVTALEVGQRVGIEAVSGCGKCYACRTGHRNLCANWKHLGLTRDGTFAEYVVAPDDSVHVLPDNVDFADAAVLEPLSLVVRSTEHIQPAIGESAVIIGPGTVGLLHLEALVAAGLSKLIVVGLDADKIRFGIAEELGATNIVNASKEDPVEAVLDITGGRGTDIVVETASSPKVWDFLLDITAARGRISAFGLYPESNFKPLTLIRKGITIYGDVASLQRHFIRAISWLESGKVSMKPLVKKRFSLDQAEEAFAAFKHKETVKCLFDI
jgi:threonine dehydrogenase-like Zn-dependent dehydrogenase